MIGLGLKNYPKKTLWMSKSIHRIKRYSDIYFDVSWLKSADLYIHSWFDQTIRLALKNNPKMALWMSKSVQWVKRYSNIYFDVSWFVKSQLIWSNYWIGLEKLTQNDPLNVQISPLDQNLLMCYLLDLYRIY